MSLRMFASMVVHVYLKKEKTTDANVPTTTPESIVKSLLFVHKMLVAQMPSVEFLTTGLTVIVNWDIQVCRDPYSHDGCNKTVVTSCMTGDPHYYSFDRNFFDYQGTCPYVVSKNCKSIAPYADFVIKARNALVRPAAHVSYVVEVEVETHGINIHIDEQLNLYVNGVVRNYNFYYPNRENPEVSVENNFGQIVINTIDGLQILFRRGYLCVTIPDVPELQGASTLCGMLGNRDGNCKNDLTMSNGTIITDDQSKTPCKHDLHWMGSEIFGDSWIINKTDFLNTIGDYFCEPGHIVANTTLNCTEQENN
uniref:VWFD domain-containing protein n=1 Tax=Acrobeloides nanus TaxID=290746 RepID=A0A914EGW1_9BILA